LEATPAESTSYRLAKHDRKRWPAIKTAGEEGDTPYYTNSSNLPVGYTEDIFEALDIQDQLQTLYTSGTVFHAFLGEKLPDWQAAAKLVRTRAGNYKLPYYTISPTYSICKNHGYISGEQFTCPECGAKAEVYSRITGYYRPVQNWNEGKTQEYKNRKLYDTDHSRSMPIKNCSCGQEEVSLNLDEIIIDPSENATYLFTTRTCPNCKMAKEYLGDLPYYIVDAEENTELTQEYGIMQAPTLVVVKEGQFKKYTNVSNIKRYAEEQLVSVK
jgi:ribonucleoside-triphosphate reductase